MQFTGSIISQGCNYKEMLKKTPKLPDLKAAVIQTHLNQNRTRRPWLTQISMKMGKSLLEMFFPP